MDDSGSCSILVTLSSAEAAAVFAPTLVTAATTLATVSDSVAFVESIVTRTPGVNRVAATST